MSKFALDFIMNILVIFLIYILPFFAYIYILGYKEKKFKIISLKTIIATIVYILIVIFSPSIISNIFPFIISIIIIINMKKEKIIDYEKFQFNLKKVKFLNVLKYCVMTYLLSIVVSLIWNIILKFLGIEMKTQPVINILSGYSLLKFLISVPSVVIFAPVLEEFIFRYIIFEKILNKHINVIVSAILTSLLFAGIHFSLSAFAILFSLSMINCYLIHKKGYWYSVGTHIFLNSISTIILLIGKIV